MSYSTTDIREWRDGDIEDLQIDDELVDVHESLSDNKHKQDDIKNEITENMT